jgi:hypothetical protein
MEENVSNEGVTVRSVGIKYGLIITVYNVVFFLALSLAGLNAFDNKWGWINMVVSVVVLVLAQKNFKDTGDGFMSYAQGIGIAFWISLVSVIVTGVFSYLYAEVISPDVMERFFDTQREDMEAKNMPDNQIDVAITWTRKLFWPLYVFMGMLFGILIALIVTIFTQKRNPDPNQIS